jgi:small subunit ribosomal protein S2
MALPEVSLRQLLEAGVHFGHQSHRWNPKMGKYIFGERNKIHILDLAQTVPLFSKALKVVSDTVSKGGRVLFVGTKRQAAELVADAAKRSAQYYVNSRWLGGMLTNWKTISNSIQRLKKVEQMLESEQGFTKKERLTLSRELEKLNRALGGIRDMGGLPDLIVVIDTNKEALAIKEAQRLGIPVAAIVDSNCNPEGITYPVPGNDDAGRAIALYCDLIARAAIDGIGRSQGASGQDVGALENPFIAEVHESVEQIPGLERLTAPRGTADDLSKLTGVGPALEKKLNEYGIFHYWQIAGLTDAAVVAVDAELKLAGRIQRDGWVAQASGLVD